ncbi:PadR family transcriptional regulator [Corynebacterium lubricantis]|uniref:PadR family transcriptional regulator n=1 Tax=Corynebacterium lubricantis TaxID=541095 RepID=UPI00037274DC|nr:PadR family transcriptional regulator [Corynebacterium lubricantis]
MELKHAILGLLSLKPMSGYDLGRAFKGSVAHFWHADLSQIYRTLGRLESAKLIDTEVIPQEGKPDRKVHSLTEAGAAELREWLESPLEAERVKEPFLARLFFAAPLGEDAVLALLSERKRHAEEVIAELSEIDIAGDDLASVLRGATRMNGVHHAKAEIEWIEQIAHHLSEREPTKEP